jgi:hypothetical protein
MNTNIEVKKKKKEGKTQHQTHNAWKKRTKKTKLVAQGRCKTYNLALSLALCLAMSLIKPTQLDAIAKPSKEHLGRNPHKPTKLLQRKRLNQIIIDTSSNSCLLHIIGCNARNSEDAGWVEAVFFFVVADFAG